MTNRFHPLAVIINANLLVLKVCEHNDCDDIESSQLADTADYRIRDLLDLERWSLELQCKNVHRLCDLQWSYQTRM